MEEITAKKVIITSLVVDIIDILTNTTVSLVTGSMVMTAEALQGMADITAVGFLFIGLIRSSRPADKVHPFGYSREIYFWTLISSVIMLIFTASLSFFLGLQRFLHPEVLDNIQWAFVVLVIAILTNGYALTRDIKRILGKRSLALLFSTFIQSPQIETKTTLVLDLMGVGAAIVGLGALLSYKAFANPRLDGIGAMGIGVILAILSLLLIFGVRDLLIGKRASKEIEKDIRQFALSFPEVREIVDLKTVHTGSSHILVNMDVNLENKLTTDEIEKLVDKIKQKIKKNLPSDIEIQIELKESS